MPKPERKAPSQEEMTLGELLEKYKTACINDEEGISLIIAHLLKKGTDPKLIKDLGEACCDISRLKDLSVEIKSAGELPINADLQEAIREVDRLEKAILAE